MPSVQRITNVRWRKLERGIYSAGTALNFLLNESDQAHPAPMGLWAFRVWGTIDIALLRSWGWPPQQKCRLASVNPSRWRAWLVSKPAAPPSAPGRLLLPALASHCRDGRLIPFASFGRRRSSSNRAQTRPSSNPHSPNLLRADVPRNPCPPQAGRPVSAVEQPDSFRRPAWVLQACGCP